MRLPVLRTVALLAVIAFRASAQDPAPPKLPQLNDPALRLEKFATFPEVEACTTVVGAPDGSVYVGCDPRDTRLNTLKPECSIVRFSSLGPEKKRTVFAEGLYSPAGSAWHDGWLYVIHDPLMSRFKDTNGDGVADVREDLITNLGLPPYEGLNDHVVSGFTLGMDGFFYISVGDRGIYQAKGKDGSEVSLRGGGIVRCRPDGTQLEIFSTGTRNHLAVLLDAEDNAFTLDNTDDGNGWWTRLTHHIEGGYYGYPYDYQKAPNYGVTQPSQQTLDAMKRNGHGEDGKTFNVQRPTFNVQGQEQNVAGGPSAPPSTLGVERWTLNVLPSVPAFLPAMADFGPGSPTGGLCYLSDGLPAAYRGKLLFSEWGKQNVSVVEVAREGATFRFVKSTPLIQSVPGTDFRPMQLSVAADGSLLIADWGWGGWKSPKKLGTIWRITWPEAKPAPRLADESKASVEELLAALGHADRDQRLRAQFALVAKGDGVVEKLSALVKDEGVAVVQRMHATWALENIMGPVALGFFKPYSDAKAHLINTIQLVLTGAGRQPDADLSAQAIRALSYRRTCFDCEIVGGLAAELSTSPNAAVRRQAALAMARMGYVNLPPLLLRLLDDSDSWVRFAARFALAREIEEYGLGAFDFDTKVLAKPELSEHEWLMLERIQLAQGKFAAPADPHPLPNARAMWGQEDVLPFIAERLTGKFSATPKDRARAASVLGHFAYQPKPYDGKWWGTQPVKNPAPLNSVAWAGTPAALAALTAALGDAESGVRGAAAQAFSGFTLDEAGQSAGTVLRARLAAETDAAVRRQLIETLGVQRDPEAMGVFTAIALDDKADAALRETAINAVVSIGGDAARKTVAQLASAQVSPAATRKIIQAAGELRVLEAAPALIAQLAGTDAGNRQFAIKALAQLGPKANATVALSAALTDPDDKVKLAALEALGVLRDRAALPALLDFAKTKKNQKELIATLANLPDPQFIPLLVNALRDNNSGIRRSALKALKTMREAALPSIEEMLASGKIPKEFEPEIRAAFDSGAIVKWKMVGVFENVWAAVHEPEKDALAAAGVADLTKKYHNAEGRDVGWIDVTADADTGRVDLGQVFKTNAMVCAYAFTEIDADADAEAKLFTSADDEIAVWINGRQILNQPGVHGYEPDQNETAVPLRQGKNQVFVKLGNKAGPWLFHARMPGLDNGRFVKPTEPPPDVKQRAFVLAQKPDGTWANAGEAKRGAKIFHDPNGPLGGICAQCHKVGETGGETGPNLTLVGSLYKRGDLLTSILEPSKTIALGYEQVMVETKGGDLFAGAVRKETDDELTLLGADMQPHVVKKADLKSRKPVETSIMPPGLTLGLKPEDVVDLLAYLESLRGK